MIRNYLKIIFRQFSRYKSFTIINVLGLSAGLTCSLMIGLYIVDEFSFDKQHAHVDRIFMVTTEATFDGQTNRWTGVPNKVAPTAAKEIPEVEKAARLFPHDFGNIAFVSTDEIKSSEKQLAWADPEIFDILTYTFVEGDPQTALTRPSTAVVSESAAIKYFGTTQALGKTIKVDNEMELEITGVFKDPPSNSRFQHPIIGSFQSHWFGKEANQSWSNASFETFLLLHAGTDQAAAEKKLAEMLSRNVAKEERWFTLRVKPLKDLYLFSQDIQDFANPEAKKGDVRQLEILGALGLIVLLIAAVNYMNLSTAQSQRRFKEIGIGKALGATRQQLARQFYTETAVFVWMALVISLIITGKGITLHFLVSGWFWLCVAGAWMVLSLLAGFYPAIYLSAFSPKEVLKGGPMGLGGNAALRKGLVVVQFTASIILIISTIILNQQLGYIREKKLGYEPEQVVAVLTSAAENTEQVLSLKAALEQLPSVTKASRSQSYPGAGASGRTLPPLNGQGEGASLKTVRATSEIVDVLGIKLLAGKTLPENKTKEDTTIQVLLNKSAVDYLGISPEEAINRKIKIHGFQNLVEVVGVTDDFHFASLHEKISAYCFHNARTESFNYLLVKAQTTNLPSTMHELEETYKKIIPSAFEFTFLDQRLETMYQSETRLAEVILLFAGLAIFIACLGLYALAAYTTERRTKEIGIRKALGASVFQLAQMLSGDFVKLVIVSFIVAAPLGYYLMNQWLQGFAYRVNVNILVLVLAGALSVLIAWLTVGIESVKAARTNPVKSLRSE